MRVQRADVVQRPILDQTDADHVGNRHEAVRGIVLMVAGKASFAGVCLSDPAAWISALIPLVPYYFYVTHSWRKELKKAA